MDAAILSEMKAVAEENRRLKKMYAEMAIQNELLTDALEKVVRPSQRREMAKEAVRKKAVSLAVACPAFGISEICHRYEAKLSDENTKIADWMVGWQVRTQPSAGDLRLVYIQPGKPQQNAYVERYNRTVRHEWLGQFIWNTIEEVKDHATRWLWTYNNERPHMGIDGITPAMKLKLAARSLGNRSVKNGIITEHPHSTKFQASSVV